MLLLLGSCHGKFEQYQEIKGMRWNEEDVYQFEYAPPKTGEYDVYLLIRYSESCPLKKLPLEMTLESKADKKVYRVVLAIRDDKGHYIGNGLGDLYDIESRLDDPVLLTGGIPYVFSLRQRGGGTIPLLMEAGLRVVKRDK